MKLKYAIDVDNQNITVRHIYGRQGVGQIYFAFVIDNKTDVYDFRLDILGLFESPHIDFTEIVGDILVFDKDKKVTVLCLNDALKNHIEFRYQTVLNLNLKNIFTRALFCFRLENNERFPMKKKIAMLQKQRMTEQTLSQSQISIAIIGMKHVGSTMVFNMVRIAYRLLGLQINETSGNYEKCQVFVTKSHDIDDIKIQTQKYVSVVRDIRDSAISGFMRFHYKKSLHPALPIDMTKEIMRYGLNIFFESMIENIYLYEKSLLVEPYVFRYEAYKNDRLGETKKLFDFLCIPYTNDEFLNHVISVTEQFIHNENLPLNLKDYIVNSSQTLDNLLTKDHITSNGEIGKWKTVFEKHHLDMLYEEPLIRDFLVEHGYCL